MDDAVDSQDKPTPQTQPGADDGSGGRRRPTAIGYFGDGPGENWSPPADRLFLKSNCEHIVNAAIRTLEDVFITPMGDRPWAPQFPVAHLYMSALLTANGDSYFNLDESIDVALDLVVTAYTIVYAGHHPDELVTAFPSFTDEQLKTIWLLAFLSRGIPKS